MKILLNTPSITDGADPLVGMVYSLVPSKDVHLTRDVHDFKKELLKYRLTQPIVVAKISGSEDLQAITNLSDILEGLFLIIVVGKKDEDLYADCLKLYPRLMTYCQEKYEVVAAVIKKRLDSSNHKLFRNPFLDNKKRRKFNGMPQA